MISFRLRNRVDVTTAALVIVVMTGCGGGGADETPAAQLPAISPQEVIRQPAEQPVQQPEQPAQEPVEIEQPTVVRESETSEYGFYTIQLSSWRTRSKADAQARYYQGLGLETYVQRAEVPGTGTWFRVRVGRYSSLSNANTAAESLVNIKLDEIWFDNYSSGVPPL